MAIKNVITLGIGSSPGNIKYFLLLGLDIGAVAAAPAERTYTVDAEVRTWDISADPRTLAVDFESRTLEVV